jgi:hypothetical protein
MNDDTIALPESLHPFSHTLDHPRDLMAEDYRSSHPRDSHPDETSIRITNATGEDTYEDVATIRARNRT